MWKKWEKLFRHFLPLHLDQRHSLSEVSQVRRYRLLEKSAFIFVLFFFGRNRVSASQVQSTPRSSVLLPDAPILL
jgi:hypothetical protein